MPKSFLAESLCSESNLAFESTVEQIATFKSGGDAPPKAAGGFQGLSLADVLASAPKKPLPPFLQKKQPSP